MYIVPDILGHHQGMCDDGDISRLNLCKIVCRFDIPIMYSSLLMACIVIVVYFLKYLNDNNL